jgi:hypothetical protein
MQVCGIPCRANIDFKWSITAFEFVLYNRDELKPRQLNNELLRQRERDYKQRQKLNYDRRHRATNLEKLKHLYSCSLCVVVNAIDN